MGTLITAYVIVWAAVALYVLRMGGQQRRLGRALRALQLQLDQEENEGDVEVKAA